MANGNVMGLLGNFIQQNPNMLNQLQPPMTTVSGGVNSFPNAGVGFSTGTIDEYGNPAGSSPGGSFAQLPDPRFGTGGPRIGDPSVQPTLIQNQMFQPVQNQMPVAGSFLDQLQQSTQVLNNQIRNVVPQNSFVGNQFQMPFNFGGGFGYSPSNFTYTPGAFNQYGNIPGFNLPFIPGMEKTTLPVQGREGREGDRGAFGNQNNVSTEFVGNRGYRISPDGQVEQLDPESIDYQLNKLVFDALNIAKINPLNPLGYIDSMSQRLDPNVMKQIQAFESANPQSLTFAPGVAQSIQDVFGTPEGPLGGVTPTDIQNFTGATPPGLLNKPVNLNINPEDLSLPTTPTVASLIEATQNLQTGNQEGPQGNQGQGVGGGPIGGSQKDRFGKGTAGS